MHSQNKLLLSIFNLFKNKKRRNTIIIIGSIIVLAIIGNIMPKDFDKLHEQENKSELNKIKNYEIEARLKAEDIIKQHAVNPAEAEFSNQKEEIHGSTYHCTGIITSKNNFGVKKQAKYLVKLLHDTSKPNEWELKSEDLFQ